MADKPLVLETRTVETSFELREAESTAPVLEGYAATFSQPYDLGAFREVIDPAAFTRTLQSGPDVRLLIDHEGQPLARTKSGTLELSADSQGLHMRSTLDPSDPDVQRLLPKMRRGDLDQMSFGFRVPKGGDTWENDLRTLREINLAGGDVSVVTYPANPNTSVALRSRDVRDAQFVYLLHLVDESRTSSLSPENIAKLKHVLDLIAASDDAVDAAQPILAEVIGVPNPDADEASEPAEANSARPLGLALAIAQRLGIPA
jgi:hypothetical protein